MEILQNQRKRRLASVAVRAQFTNRTGRRIQKEGTIVGLAVVVTCCAETQRAAENQNCRRERPPARLDQWRIEWREVGPPLVVTVLKSSPGRIHTERAQHNDDGNQFYPPGIAAHRSTKAASFNCRD